MKKYLYKFAITLTIAHTGILFGQDDTAIEEDFLSSLNEASEIIAKEKLNIDKIPSTVTVIRRKTIEHSGARTLYDILAMVPGIDISMSASGKREVVVRGSREKYRDKIKLLVDGIDVTNNLYSNQFYYYLFPAALIKRVEVTKTPDAIYGSNSLLGVVNIITFLGQKGNAATFDISSENSYLATLYQRWAIKNGTLSIDMHKGYSNPDIEADPTLLIDLAKHRFSTLRPKELAHALEKTKGVGIEWNSGDFKLEYRYQNYIKGSFFGISNVVPLAHDHDVSLSHHALQASYDGRLGPEWRWHLQGSDKEYIWDGSYRTFPYDFQPTDDLSKDVIMGAYIHEREIGAMGYLKYEGLIHAMTIQAEGAYAKPVKSYYIQYIPAIGQQETHFTGEKNIIKEGIKRTTKAISWEDLITPWEDFSLILGIRADHYSDFGYHRSWKAGIVKQIGDADVLKVLYNDTFRAPSWIELYAKAEAEFHGNENLKPETMQMLEGVWLHHFSNSNRIQLNVFMGRNDDPIVRAINDQGLSQYINGDRKTFRGMELSWRWESVDNDVLFLSASFTNNSDPEIECQKANSPKKNIKGWFDWHIEDGLHLFSQASYRSSITVDHPGQSLKVPSSFVVNETLTKDIGTWSIKGGIKNLFDDDVEYLAGPSDRIKGRYVLVPSRGEIRALGREFYLRIEKRW